MNRRKAAGAGKAGPLANAHRGRNATPANPSRPAKGHMVNVAFTIIRRAR